MTKNLDTHPGSLGDRERGRAYARDFVPSMVGYVVVLGVVMAWGHLDGTSSWRYLWAVLPVLPALGVVRAVLRHARRVDEYQQRLLFEGIGLGFALSMVAAVTLGFLGIAGLDVRLGGWAVYVVGMLGWVVGSATAAKR